jgi:hypothetical protein
MWAHGLASSRPLVGPAAQGSEHRAGRATVRAREDVAPAPGAAQPLTGAAAWGRPPGQGPPRRAAMLRGHATAPHDRAGPSAEEEPSRCIGGRRAWPCSCA